MKNKENYTKDEVIEMLQGMQQGFIVGHLATLWVVRDLIGEQIKELGGEEIAYKVK